MPQSFHSQQAQGPITLARFQLAKFSYTCTSVNHRGPLTWSHILGNGNLIGVFETYTTCSSGRVLFRVLDNLVPLEEICITDLMNEFEHQLHSSQKSSGRPPFAVVVKLPCLAVKYPQGPTYIKRFQIKFLNEKDFYSALAVLSEINCPFSESNINSVRPMNRPATALPSVGRIDSGPGPGLQRYPSTTIETSIPSSSACLPFRSSSIFTSPSTRTPASSVPPHHRSSSIIRDIPPDTVLPPTASNSGTLSSTSRHFISSALTHSSSSSLHKALFEDRPSTKNIPLASTNPDAGRFMRPSTSTGFTGFHDVEELQSHIPPRRDLPFSVPKAKRSRSTPEATDQITTKKATTATNTTDKPSVTSPSLPKGKGLVLRTSKGQNSPKKAQSKPVRAKSPSSIPNNPHDQTMKASTSATTTNSATKSHRVAVEPHSEPVFLFPSFANGEPTPAEVANYISNPNPTVEETARVQGWLCALLQDDNFLKLAVDVEALWQRVFIGIGRVD